MRSNARLRLLAEVSRAFSEAAPGYQSLVQTIARALADHMGDACAVLLRSASGEGLLKAADAHRDLLEQAACRALQADLGVWQISGQSVAAKVASTGVPVLVPEVQPDAFLARVPEAIKPLAARLNVHSLLVVPIRARSSILGSLALVRCRAGDSYTADDLSLLQELADRAGLAIENVRLFEAMQEHAVELKRANEVFRHHAALIDSIPDAVVSTDAQLCIRGWNVRAERIFGWTLQEVLGKPGVEVLGLSAARATNAEAALQQLRQVGTWSTELRLKRKDGSQALMFVSAAALTDDAGQVTGTVSIMREIGKQREAEEAARKLAALVECTDDAIHSLSPDGIVQHWNRASERLFGYSAAEALGRHISFLAGGRNPTQTNMIARAARGERIPPFEAVRMRKDGSKVEIGVTVSPVVDDAGRVTAIAGVARDISERRKLERQLLSAERMASVGMLAAGIAHEINNPLTYVLGNLDVVLAELAAMSGTDADRARELTRMLGDARDGAERIARIVRGLKAFCRTEAEPHVSLSLERVLETALRLADNELKHCARIVKDYGKTPTVIADEGGLVQVFVNLLINAAHALPEDRREQNEVCISTRTDERGRAVVQVRDTGTGIPEAIIGKIFEPFVTTKAAGKGSGLGLSICQRIIASHNGEISFESSRDTGTTFRVTLPAAAAEAQPPLDEEPASYVENIGRRGRILIIDDEPMIGDVLAKILSTEHAVVVCRSGRAAMDCIEAGDRFDGILCDLMMPGLTGMDVYAGLKASVPSQAERMVFLTGGTFTPASREFLESVANPCIGKPFDAKEVRALVRDLIE